MHLKKIAIALLFLLPRASAHCPLCTMGAAAAAGGALWLGINSIVVALFIGAFAVSMGWWMGRLIKKRYIPFQKTLIILISFLLTILPILPMMSTVEGFYLDLGGEYGSWFNRTYLINMSLISSIAGGAIVSLSPWISKKITYLRKGKNIPFQGIWITFALLIIGALIIQFRF